MWPIYLLLQNFGWAIIIFTLIVKLAMLPLTLKQQKNMAYSQMFAPKVREIQQKYKNNREKQTEELTKLQQQGYNPTGGCGPMVLTMLLLFGVIDVVYKPMTHMEHMASSDISGIVEIATQTEYAQIFLNDYNAKDKELVLAYKSGNKDEMFISESDNRAQLTHEFKDDEGYKNAYTEKDPEAISKDDRTTFGEFTQEQLADLLGDKSRLTQETKNRISMVRGKYQGLQKELLSLQIFQVYPDCFYDSSIISDGVKSQLANLSENMSFCGLDLGKTPKLEFDWLIIIPIISFLFSLGQTLLTQYFNKKNNPAAAEMGGASMKVMLYIMPLFSLWIAFSVPAGVGFYWAISYVFGIIQSLFIQKFYHPEKLKAEAEAKFNARKKEVTTTAVITDAETGEEKTVTKTETVSQKELNRRKLAAARKADAEKYGEEDYDDDSDSEESTEGLSQKEINRRKLAAARKADAEKYGEDYGDDE